MNNSRILETFVNYDIENKTLNIEDKIKYIINYNLINIDIDLFINKKQDNNKIINKLIELWKSDPINNFKMLIKKLDDMYIEFNNPMQNKLNKYFTQNLNFNKKITEKISLNDENQILSNGKTTIINNDDNTDNDTDNDNDSDSDDENTQIIIVKKNI